MRVKFLIFFMLCSFIIFANQLDLRELRVKYSEKSNSLINQGRTSILSKCNTSWAHCIQETNHPTNNKKHIEEVTKCYIQALQCIEESK